MRASFRWAGLVAVALALAACTGNGGQPPDRAADTRIGVLSPLSGPNAAAGREAFQGAELAATLINDGSAVISELTDGAGLAGRQLTLVSADTAGDPAVAAAAAVNLVAEQRATGLVGAYDPDVTATVSQRTERLKVPFVNGDATATHLTDRGLDWFFRVGPTDRMLGEALFSVLQLQEAAGADTRRIAILHPDDQQGAGVAGTVETLAAEGGYAVAATVAFQPGAADLTAQVASVRDAEPDAVFLAAFTAADAVRLVRTFEQVGYTPPGLLALGSGFAGPAFVREAGSGAEGLFRAVTWSPELAARNPVAAAVADQYTQAYGAPMTPTAAGTFMAVLTLAQAVDAGGAPDAQAVRTALTTLSEPGRSTIAPWDGVDFDVTHQNAAAAGAVEQLRGGKAPVVFPREVARESPAWPLADARNA